uniref:DUF2813 domain-containing protein n=1 Tax=Anaerobiospirillum succiniciproducens TaxID=13335 RepID=UPI0029427D11
MYLQSAEIRNFRGIRHLSVDFEKDTSVLIGENAWGKSSLLYALFMILGCGSQRLCRFSSDDLYVPIKLDFDKDNKAPNSSSSSTVILSDAADVSLSADGEISASRASQSSLDASGNDLESSTAAKYSSSNNERQIAQAVKQIFNLDERAQYVKMVEDKKYKYLIYAIPSDDGKSQEISAAVTHELYKTI